MTEWTALTLGKKIQAGEISAVEATKAALERIKNLEPTLNSFITVEEESALKQAEEVQKKIAAGELTGPLAGVPAALKDNLCTEGIRTTCGSRILQNFIPVRRQFTLEWWCAFFSRHSCFLPQSSYYTG